MMGAWLNLIVAGVSYAVVAQRRLMRAEMLLRDAQLAALRSRLNPHFLFNALHALSALLPDPAPGFLVGRPDRAPAGEATGRHRVSYSATKALAGSTRAARREGT
jgi:hypothetical protein